MGLDSKISKKVNPLPQVAYNPKRGRVKDVGSLPSTGKKGGRATMGTSMPSSGKKSL